MASRPFDPAFLLDVGLGYCNENVQITQQRRRSGGGNLASISVPPRWITSNRVLLPVPAMKQQSVAAGSRS